MIDYANITPILSLPTFTALIIGALVAARAYIEISDKKTQRKRERLGMREGMTPSQRAVQRYYDERKAG